MKRLRRMGSTLGKYAEIWITLLALILLIAIVAIWIVSPADLTAIRDYGLLIAAIVAFPLAFWRSRVAERQASAAQEQVRTTQHQLRTSQLQADAAQAQVETSKQSLSNERYQRGAEMLGSKVLAVRLGGIYALQSLAKEQPEEYHVQIMRLLCAFVRNPPAMDNGEAGRANYKLGESAEPNRADAGGCLRQDVEAVMEAIATRNTVGIGLERDVGFRLDFREANLSGLDLSRVEGVNFSRARLTGANLSHVKLHPHSDLSSIPESYGANLSEASLNRVNFRGSNLWEADLTGSLLIGSDLEDADLRHADLSRATLANADLSGAELRGAILSGTKFSIAEHPHAKGLTQEELDNARPDPEPPRLDGVLDAFTGEQLVWRGEPRHDQA